MTAATMKARRAHLGGFTLLEVLVVMSLLSVVMLALGSALRTVAQTEERIDERLARADEMRIAVGFMRATLGRVSARKVAPPPPGALSVMFSGGTDSVAWVGVMPARYGAGGRFFFRLGLEPDNAQTALVIRFAPWADSASFPDWTRADFRILVRNATRLTLGYLDSEPSPAQWSAAWAPFDRIPNQLQLEIETTAGAWPSLNFPMRTLPISDPSTGGAVFGGGN